METGTPAEPADALPAVERYPGALCERFAAYDEFLPGDAAEALRAPIDAHFSEPHKHGSTPTSSGITGTCPASTPICAPRRRR